MGLPRIYVTSVATAIRRGISMRPKDGSGDYWPDEETSSPVGAATDGVVGRRVDRERPADARRRAEKQLLALNAMCRCPVCAESSGRKRGNGPMYSLAWVLEHMADEHGTTREEAKKVAAAVERGIYREIGSRRDVGEWEPRVVRVLK